MFSAEQQAVASKIRLYCAENGLPEPGEVQWNPIPFTGEWGISTSFFQLAAQEARKAEQSRPKTPVPLRAQEIAASIASSLGSGTPPVVSATDAEGAMLYLQARHAWNQRTETGFRRAL